MFDEKVIAIEEIEKKQKEIFLLTSHYIYVAIKYKGQCGMLRVFNSKHISKDIINRCYNERRSNCKTRYELNLNEEICERLLLMKAEDRLECCKIAKQKFLST